MHRPGFVAATVAREFCGRFSVGGLFFSGIRSGVRCFLTLYLVVILSEAKDPS